MTKSDLVDVVAGKAKISKKVASDILDAFTEAIIGTLKKGNKVTLIGFGTFNVINRKSRLGMNPQTKGKIKIKASKAPRFKAGKTFKDAVNK